MLEPTRHIVIGDITLTAMVKVEISSSYKQLTDTCTITIPRRVKYKGEIIHLGNAGLIKAGDPVVVQLGYGDQMEEVFRGQVTNVNADYPVVIKAEDDAVLLKKGTVKPREFPTGELGEILDYILQGVDLQHKAHDTKLGKFIIKEETTPAKVLEEIFRVTGCLYSFIRDGVLYVGLPYWAEYQKVVKFGFGRNIKGHRLEQVRAEDVKLKVKAVSIKKDNSKLEVEVGDKDGDLRTLHFYNIQSKAELEKLATEQLDSLKYDGLKGHITAFGLPRVQQGDVVELSDALEPESFRTGQYLVEAVNTRSGLQGFEQKLEPGRKL